MYSALCVILVLALSFVTDLAGIRDYLHNHLPQATVAIAVGLAPFMQLLKKYVAGLNGWVALLANFVLSILAVFATTPAGDFWTVAAWMQVISISGIAAGIHGTATKLAANPGAIDNPTPSGTPAQQNKLTASPLPVILFACLLLGSAGLTGCVHSAQIQPLPAGAVDQVDAQANRTLQTIHAFLAHVSADVQSGKLQLTASQRSILDKANMATNDADLAEQSYHKAGGGDAGALNAALTAAQAAFIQAEQAIAPTAN